MGLFKSLVDKVKGTQKDLEKKAAKMALEQGAKAARSALDLAGDAIERAIFGDDDAKADSKDDKDATSASTKTKDAPDPFAKLKAVEAAKKERAREEKRLAKERVAAEAKREDDVDAELEALKKKLGK